MNAPLLPPALEAIRAHEAGMVAIRRQIHAHPGLAHEAHATSDLVAERLQRWGWEVHRGRVGTGVVGTKGGCMVHNAGDDFNDRVLSTGATCWVKLPERWLAPQS